jgi:hypothetical protein
MDPDHRVDASELLMATSNCDPDLAVEGREEKRVLALVTQDKLHARCAETAAAVV